VAPIPCNQSSATRALCLGARVCFRRGVEWGACPDTTAGVFDDSMLSARAAGFEQPLAAARWMLDVQREVAADLPDTKWGPMIKAAGDNQGPGGVRLSMGAAYGAANRMRPCLRTGARTVPPRAAVPSWPRPQPTRPGGSAGFSPPALLAVLGALVLVGDAAERRALPARPRGSNQAAPGTRADLPSPTKC
jgi:hypothetical protein